MFEITLCIIILAVLIYVVRTASKGINITFSINPSVLKLELPEPPAPVLDPVEEKELDEIERSKQKNFIDAAVAMQRLFLDDREDVKTDG